MSSETVTGTSMLTTKRSILGQESITACSASSSDLSLRELLNLMQDKSQSAAESAFASYLNLQGLSTHQSYGVVLRAARRFSYEALIQALSICRRTVEFGQIIPVEVLLATSDRQRSSAEIVEYLVHQISQEAIAGEQMLLVRATSRDNLEIIKSLLALSGKDDSLLKLLFEKKLPSIKTYWDEYSTPTFQALVVSTMLNRRSMTHKFYCSRSMAPTQMSQHRRVRMWYCVPLLQIAGHMPSNCYLSEQLLMPRVEMDEAYS